MDRRRFMTCLGGGAAGAIAAPSTGTASSPDRPVVRTYVTNVDETNGLPALHEPITVQRGGADGYDRHALNVSLRSGQVVGRVAPIHSRILAPLVDGGYRVEGWVEGRAEGPRPSIRIALAIVPPEAHHA